MKKRRKPRKIVPPSKSREELEQQWGKTWDTSEVAREVVITSIISNEVVVRRKSDNRVGKLTFQNDPLLYYNFVEALKLDDEE
jgi:hypothetical protein